MSKRLVSDEELLMNVRENLSRISSTQLAAVAAAMFETDVTAVNPGADPDDLQYELDTDQAGYWLTIEESWK